MFQEVRNNPGSIRKTKRVYLARTKDLSEDEIREYFEEYIGKDMGHVEIVELLRNKDTGVHRGFGFINFSTFEAADKVCSKYPFSHDYLGWCVCFNHSHVTGRAGFTWIYAQGSFLEKVGNRLKQVFKIR